jgi:hypothetical protein
MDPDPGGPKTCGSGSPTLKEALTVTLIDEVRKGMRSSSLSDRASCSRSRKQRITPDQSQKLVRPRSDPVTEYFVTDPGTEHFVTDAGTEHFFVTNPGTEHFVTDPGTEHFVTDPGTGLEKYS